MLLLIAIHAVAAWLLHPQKVPCTARMWVAGVPGNYRIGRPLMKWLRTSDNTQHALVFQKPCFGLSNWFLPAGKKRGCAFFSIQILLSVICDSSFFSPNEVETCTLRVGLRPQRLLNQMIMASSHDKYELHFHLWPQGKRDLYHIIKPLSHQVPSLGSMFLELPALWHSRSCCILVLKLK